jgi:hypothetical protein
MVTGISEARLVILFVEGLSEPLRGWVKDYKSASLQDAVSRTHDMQDAVPKIWFPPKPIFTPKTETRPPQRDWVGKPKLDEDTRRELRKKKLCFSCHEPWALGQMSWEGKNGQGPLH